MPGVSVFGAVRAETGCDPVHVGEQVGWLHGGDDAQAGEAIEVRRKQNLRVFDAEAEVGGGGGGGGGGDDGGVGLLRGSGAIGGDGGLLGGGEGVEGHVVGTVADGVEA